jgi:4'-phosphopantetheinyl transferase
VSQALDVTHTTYATWETPPTTLDLPGDQVQLWRVRLAWPEDQVQRWATTLAEDERARAAQFHFEVHRRRFQVAHGALRLILGLYLRRLPADIAFRKSDHGKLELAEDVDDLRFNLSHAADGALLGVTRGRDLGVDLENLRMIPDLEGLAQQFFAPGEVADLLAVPHPERGLAFFRCWTRKEAYIKALGLGLACPLDRFRVSLAPAEGTRLLEVDGSAAEAARWVLREVIPWPGYIGCVAVPETGWRLRCFAWGG